MPNATVCLTYDFDAVSVWIHTFGASNAPTQLSRGIYGAWVGAPRLLDLHDKHDIPATWFVPGHTIESFPDRVGEVHDRGYDIQCHGWRHVNPATFDGKEAEQSEYERAISNIEDVTGRKPTGFRSPAWEFSEHTLEIIEELGFEWDSSQMGNDFAPYHLRKNWKAPDSDPFELGDSTDIIEVPISWKRADFPALMFVWEQSILWGYANERAVFDLWKTQFDWMYENVEDGIFTLAMHPQVIGQPPRTRRLEELIQHMQTKPGVEFAGVDTVVTEIRDGEREVFDVMGT
ncbi:Polysaccharide deacetylase [Haladaptatus litoreus]|uniref:Polysaccharide deacetylase n=1 Tax=Haladaptatus litoreus TaxID=553468 RepID=A0A1N7BWJ8_9EURY|nr:polysaccharide deacetylase [Haladaptatus litoreus]SIR55715.1 Polysaccharide deacetylase [Haladaptatus litoreus]